MFLWASVKCISSRFLELIALSVNYPIPKEIDNLDFTQFYQSCQPLF